MIPTIEFGITIESPASKEGTVHVLLDNGLSYNFDNIQFDTADPVNIAIVGGLVAGNSYVVTVYADDGTAGNSTSPPVQFNAVAVLSDTTAPLIVTSSPIQVQHGQTHVADIQVTDAAPPITYSLSGADANAFSLDYASGSLDFVSPPDYSNPLDSNRDNSYDITVSIIDSKNGRDSRTVRVAVVDPTTNHAPVGSIDDIVISDTTGYPTVQFSISDPDGDGMDVYLQVRGTSTYGSATLQSGYWYATLPVVVSDGDKVMLWVSDSKRASSLADTYVVKVDGTTTDTAPVINNPSSVTVQENQVDVMTVDVVDTDGDAVALSLSGPDASKFYLNTTTNVITFVAAPDYENPTDSNSDNIYDFTIRADDGRGGISSKDIYVTVTDVAENSAPTGTIDSVLITDSGFLYMTITLADNDSDPVNMQISVNGNIDGTFTGLPVGGTSYSGNTAMHDGDVVSLSVGDSLHQLVETDTYTITPATNRAPIFTSTNSVDVNEGQTSVMTLTATDANNDILTYSIYGPDAALFTVDTSTGVITFNSAPDYNNPADADGDNVYQITAYVDDGNGGHSGQDITINVQAVAQAYVGINSNEITEWRTRKNTTQTAEWAALVAAADHFKDGGAGWVSSSHAPENTPWRPTGPFDGTNNSPIRGSSAVSGWSGFSDHATIVDCALVGFIFTEDGDTVNGAAYLDPVKSYLLANAAAPELDFTSTDWANANNADANNMDVAIWIHKWASAYRYLRPHISSTDQTTLDTWFTGAGQWCLDWVTYISRHVRQSLYNWWDTSSPLDYYGAWDPEPLYELADGTDGPKPVGHSQMGKENRQQIAMSALALIGLLVSDQLFIERCEEYYRQTIQWGIIGDQCDVAEWQRTTSTTESSKGIAYGHILLSYLYQIGESVGRYRGNSALLDYETTAGDIDPRVSDGTADSTSTTPKSLRKAYLRQADIDSENPVIYSYTHAGVFDYKMNLYNTDSGRAHWTSVYSLIYAQPYFQETKLDQLIDWTLPGMVAKGTAPDGDWRQETAEYGSFYTGGSLPFRCKGMPSPL